MLGRGGKERSRRDTICVMDKQGVRGVMQDTVMSLVT